jgi:membrane protease subunit (stomatin/prohibitin family)
MGLIRAGLNALGGTLASQWKEYFYVDSLPEQILATKAQKKTRTRFGGSRTEDDNVITAGSVIAVNEGQCMLIVDQGKIVDFCAEPGEYVFEQNGEPSLFYGGFNTENAMQVLKTTFDRLSFGGQAGVDQRVYFFNTKEIVGNKYGTPSAVPFRVVDANIGLDVDISIRCFGEYSYRITNPMLFYTNVCGNVEGDYSREQIDSQLKTELLTALQPAFARISQMGIRYSALPGHTAELAEALNEVLSEKWTKLRGIEIIAFGVSSVKASQEDEALIKELQRNAVFRNTNMAAAHLVGAQAQAMQDAAKNEGGAFMGFMGMNAAQATGGASAQSLFQMGAQQPQQSQQPQQTASAPPQSGWACGCGASATGRFCPECGAPKPAPEGWNCTCGAVNKGKFCQECGAKRPASAPLYRCDKCGWEPADPVHPPKFCPECGDVFDEGDVR